MHLDAFTELLARHEELERQHQAWCEDINCGADDSFYSRGRRNQIYRELLETEELIEAAIQAERAAETAAL